MDFCAALAAAIEQAPTSTVADSLKAIMQQTCGDGAGGTVTPQSGGGGGTEPPAPGGPGHS
ncbi:hypothetical protein [Sphingomonas oryzagri]|uniref:Uncharacterized protein n=1 Tax=Sphingomonas oryzagri TaxID=3042314 RepID=A0ABT6N0Y7_9SPHN|nr:hypothetical protein [Sphingomonas oryzagri]MDH7638969.1 hypothetical protein [Sphingomonas oryzagri]